MNSKQIRKLRGMAHHLNPTLFVGRASISEAVLKEADSNLEYHQLIKAKIACEDKEEFQVRSEELAEATGALLVQTMGRIAVYYRKPRLSKTKVKIVV